MAIDSTLARRMATERKLNPEPKFARAFLPWIVAAIIFGLYLLTLNRWLSIGNVQTVTTVAGYGWFPEVSAPVSFLLTLPIRALPAKFVPLALNLFAAVCAALSLALLARSVMLLPHDRTHEQRERQRTPPWLLSIPSAWLPPVIAVIACGLELSFWEHATSANTSSLFSGGIEMLDLLMFAYIIRCLLEFRISQDEKWLYKSAIAYGGAIANNWAMFSFAPPFVSFFPLFIVALIWIRGLAFFNLRFLTRMFLLGLAGMSLYLVLPIWQAFSDPSHIGFWPSLKMGFANQRWAHTVIFNKANLFLVDKPLWIIGLYSLLPLLAISIQWPSYFGDTSKLGIGIATFAFHLVHGIFFLLCAWVALDPPVSPRNHTPGLPLLTFYYLSALTLGYFVGYFLLVFGGVGAQQRRPGGLMPLIYRAISVCVWAVCLLLPITLLYKNLPQIRATNGPAFKQFASLVAEKLPPRNSVVLSDDRARLLLIQAFAAQADAGKKWLFLDTSLFPYPDYHRFLRKKYGARWPTNPGKEAQTITDPLRQLLIVRNLSTSNDLYYIHPSFGYFFELFNSEAHGLAYKLVTAPTNDFRPQPVSAEVMKENNAFWELATPKVLDPIVAAIASTESRHANNFADQFLKALHVSKEPNREAAALARFYSRALDYWGVQLQAAGDLPQAAKYFEHALELSSDNLPAAVNLKCNRLLQSGDHPAVRDPQSVLDEFGRYRGWEDIMNQNGPYDDPTFCFALGVTFARNGQQRQAIREFERAKTLAPTHLASRLWLGSMYLIALQPDESLKEVQEINSNPTVFAISRTNQAEILFVEASAQLAKHDVPAAEAAVERAVRKYPDDDDLLAKAVHVYVRSGYYSNAIPLLDRQLTLNPTNCDALLNKGFASLQLDRYDAAIPALTQLLNLETNWSDNHKFALLNRAIGYLKSGQLDLAQQDYETLQKAFPAAFQVYYGLGEVAYQRRDTNTAIRNYQLYLTNAPNNPAEINAVSARLKELRPGYP